MLLSQDHCPWPDSRDESFSHRHASDRLIDVYFSAATLFNTGAYEGRQEADLVLPGVTAEPFTEQGGMRAGYAMQATKSCTQGGSGLLHYLLMSFFYF